MRHYAWIGVSTVIEPVIQSLKHGHSVLNLYENGIESREYGEREISMEELQHAAMQETVMGHLRNVVQKPYISEMFSRMSVKKTYLLQFGTPEAVAGVSYVRLSKPAPPGLPGIKRYNAIVHVSGEGSGAEDVKGLVEAIFDGKIARAEFLEGPLAKGYETRQQNMNL